MGHWVWKEAFGKREGGWESRGRVRRGEGWGWGEEERLLRFEIFRLLREICISTSEKVHFCAVLCSGDWNSDVDVINSIDSRMSRGKFNRRKHLQRPENVGLGHGPFFMR